MPATWDVHHRLVHGHDVTLPVPAGQLRVACSFYRLVVATAAAR